MRLLAPLAAVLVVAGSAFAGPPASGMYVSTDLGGSVLTGSFSESWVGGPGQVGNTVSWASWDGASLGTQWKLWCPVIDAAPTLVSDTRDGNGTGEVTAWTTLRGGSFWLSRSGPWGDNTVHYSGFLSDGFVLTAHLYVFGQLLGVRSTITAIGVLTDYDNLVEFGTDAARYLSDTTVGPLPAEFPSFLDSNCATAMQSAGAWGHVRSLAISIPSSLPVNESTWTAAKNLYR